MAPFGDDFRQMAPRGECSILESIENFLFLSPFGDEYFAHVFFQTMPHRHVAIPPSVAKIWRMAKVGDRQMAPRGARFGDENGAIWR